MPSGIVFLMEELTLGAEVNIIVATVGIGCIAGLFLDIVLFLVLVVTPTLVIVSLIAVLSSSISAWLMPATWIAQQAAYMLVLHLTRPRAYGHVIERVRVMMKL